MAAPLGFKTFATGDVLTAADTNGYLMQGVWTFANAAARDAAVTSPQEGNVCYLKDTDAIMTYSGAAWVAVGGGGGGKVLQVVAATYTTQTLSTSTTYADTGLTATITPSLATSKVAVFISLGALSKESSGGNTGGAVQTKALRGATQIGFIESGYTGDTSRQDFGSISYAILDTPATTSATTYKAQFASLVSGQQVRVQTAGSTSSIILMEIGA